MKRTQPNGLEVYRRATVIPSQRWGWRLWSQGRIIATSGEGYTDKLDASTVGRVVVAGGYSYLLDGGK